MALAPGELADLRPPLRPGVVALGVSPLRFFDAPTLKPSTLKLQLSSTLTLRSSTPDEGQGNCTSHQSVKEALRKLQNKFAAFSQQEKEARNIQEKELQKLCLDLGEEKAKTERVEADVRSLQSENAVLRGQLQQEKKARSIQEKELQKLCLDLGEEKAKTERGSVWRPLVGWTCLGTAVSCTVVCNIVLLACQNRLTAFVVLAALGAFFPFFRMWFPAAPDVRAFQSENAVLRGQLQQVAADVRTLQRENAVLRGQLQQVKTMRMVEWYSLAAVLLSLLVSAYMWYLVETILRRR